MQVTTPWSRLLTRKLFVDNNQRMNSLYMKITTAANNTGADTLIVWTAIDGTDMALSFQEPEGCTAMWYQDLLPLY